MWAALAGIYCRPFHAQQKQKYQGIRLQLGQTLHCQYDNQDTMSRQLVLLQKANSASVLQSGLPSAAT